MIFVPFLDRTTNQLETLRKTANEIAYRGYEKKTYPPPEIFGTRLPVNLIAYNFCKTQRDVYLYVTDRELPESWERYRGRVIHSLYQEILKNIVDKIRSGSIGTLNLDAELVGLYETIVNSVLRKHRSIHNRLNAIYSNEELEPLQSQLKSEMEKIFLYEKSLSSALINFEISRLFNQSSGDSLFQKAFSLSMGQNFDAPKLGFTSPVSPDFIYKNNVVGDIKIGPWRDYYYHTIAAYALAIEFYTKSAVDCGIVLHVDTERPRPVPIHEKTSFELIDDSKRRKFLTIRDQKLLIARYKRDPGLPENPDGCDGCGYYSICWGEEE